jgi:hypothetical protein
MSDWKERAEWMATVESLEEDRVHWQERALAAEARIEGMVVKSLFKTVQAERDMWQDRAESAEAKLHELSVKYTVALERLKGEPDEA